MKSIGYMYVALSLLIAAEVLNGSAPTFAMAVSGFDFAIGLYLMRRNEE